MTLIQNMKRASRLWSTTRIAAMDPADRLAQEAALGVIFETLPGFGDARTVLLYASAFADEVSTSPWIDRAIDLGKRVALPRVEAAGTQLSLFEVRSPANDLIPGYRGIPEPGPNCWPIDPAEVDWALVPGLAFDDRGYRVGRGAGHYDRLLPRLRPDAPAWALILDVQWANEVPIEPHDRALSGVADHRRVVPRVI